MTKISALTPLGDGLAVGDQFIIRDIDDAGTPNKSVTISGITRGLDRGTNAAPAIAFAADKNTGIYSPAEDQLAVATNGTEKLIVLSNGNVGIGTSSPGFVLDINAASDAITRNRTNGNTSAGFVGSTNNGTNSWFMGSRKDAIGGTLGTDRFNILYDASTYLTVTTAGLVGIGTTSVDAAAKAAISNGGAEGLEFRAGNTAGVCEILTYNRSGSAYTDFRYDAATHQWKIGGADRMRIPSGGGLCVGSTTNPNALTQTSGIRLGSSTIASYDFTDITTSPVTVANGVGIGGLAFVQAFNTSTGAQYTGLIMWRSGVTAVISDSNSLGFGLTYSVSGSTLRLQTASGTISGSVITLAS